VLAAAYIAELPKAAHDVAEPVLHLLSGEGAGPWPLPSTAGRAYICVGGELCGSVEGAAGWPRCRMTAAGTEGEMSHDSKS
jgi:hypothetical protein